MIAGGTWAQRLIMQGRKPPGASFKTPSLSLGLFFLDNALIHLIKQWKDINPLWRPYVKCGKVQILCSLQGTGGQWWSGNYFLKDSSGYPDLTLEAGDIVRPPCEHGDADQSWWSSHCALCCANWPHLICHEVLQPPPRFSSSHIFKFNRESWLDAVLYRQ